MTVETLCEEGLIGFLLLCAVVSLALRHVWQLMKSRLESESARINYGVLMAIAVFSIALSFKQGSLLGRLVDVFHLNFGRLVVFGSQKPSG